MQYTITRFDPTQSIVEVQFEGWPDALAVPLSVDADGLLPTGEALDAIIGAAAPSLDEVARRSAVASASNHDALDALVGEARTRALAVLGCHQAGSAENGLTNRAIGCKSQCT